VASFTIVEGQTDDFYFAISFAMFPVGYMLILSLGWRHVFCIFDEFMAFSLGVG
jgi:hypothetical protein